MPATRVPRSVRRGNTGLSQHGDPVFPPFCPLNQNLARVWTMGGGGHLNEPPFALYLGVFPVSQRKAPMAMSLKSFLF